VSAFKIDWHDSGREPQCAPDPAYPNGIDIDASEGAATRCKSTLPYPAKRCGYFMVECRCCGIRVTITTAGRPDDPRSITLPCQIHGATIQ
jgi:hypothetical protein